MEQGIVTMIFGMIFGGIIGALIGRKRKIGAGWAALLGAVLGIIGWIIAVCSKKSETEFTDMSGKEGL